MSAPKYFDLARLIGDGLYRLTEGEARQLCGGELPEEGWESMVLYCRQICLVGRTVASLPLLAVVVDQCFETWAIRKKNDDAGRSA